MSCCHLGRTTIFLRAVVRQIWIWGNCRTFGPNSSPKNWFRPPFSLITKRIIKKDFLRIPKQLLSQSLQILDDHPSFSTGLMILEVINRVVIYQSKNIFIRQLSWCHLKLILKQQIYRLTFFIGN